MENQLTILADSLTKKIQVLEEIQEYNKLQEQAFTNETARLEDFDKAVEEKGRLIENLNKLDEGFEILYSKVAAQLEGNRSRYAGEIRGMQAKIQRITELSVSIQAQEKRNKQLVEQFFSKERTELHRSRKTSKAVHEYYREMRNNSYVQPQFYDNKK